MQKQEQRARVVEATIAFLEGNTLSADAYERHLLNRFVKEELTIDEALELLEMHNKATQAATLSQRT